MLPNWLRLLVQWLSVVVLFAIMFILIQWVTISFAITGTGQIKWAEGWDEVVEHWLE